MRSLWTVIETRTFLLPTTTCPRQMPSDDIISPFNVSRRTYYRHDRTADSVEWHTTLEDIVKIPDGGIRKPEPSRCEASYFLRG